LTSLVPVAPQDIFPGEQLLGHAPTLIREIAVFLQAPEHASIAANAVVAARATELGQLRHAQHASIHQVLREHRMLRLVITEFIAKEIEARRLTPTPGELIDLMDRLDVAVEALLRTTIDTYLAEYTQAITQHTARLEGFNRMVTHELRQPIGTLQFALRRLAAEDVWTHRATRDRVLETAERNVMRMNDTLGKLLALSRTTGEADSALVRRIELSAMVHDVVDQLREMADDRGVEMRVDATLPAIETDARVERDQVQRPGQTDARRGHRRGPGEHPWNLRDQRSRQRHRDRGHRSSVDLRAVLQGTGRAARSRARHQRPGPGVGDCR
jgi:signal transduction histidine kinase